MATPTISTTTKKSPAKTSGLVFRRLGDIGPVYQVGQMLGRDQNGLETVEITILETGEKLAYPHQKTLSDPLVS